MHISLIDTDSNWAWGVRMISAVLKREGYKTRLLLMAKSGDHYSQSELAQLESSVRDSDVIGISCGSGGHMRARTLLAHLRPLGKLLVWGGIHATLNPKECAQSADLVCVGEGEGMIVDLVRQLESSRTWTDILNVAYCVGERFVANPIRPLIEKMDELPLLDFSCEDELHLDDGKLVKNTSTYHFAHHEIPFVGSRGCVFHCSYCCNGRLQEIYRGAGKYVRKHSIAECVNRPTILNQKFFPDAKYIFFVDDDFLDRTAPELEEFARDFPAKAGLPFECNVSPVRVTRERIELLKRAGVWRIRMGVESGSEHTKKMVYHRAMPNSAVERASAVLAQYPEIVRAYYFIIGNPFEEQQDLLETIRLLLRLPAPYFVQVFNLIFFPGSDLFQRAVEAGLIGGMADCGYDLHYRGGFKYKFHPWKRKNLYLNTIIFMMDGKVTRHRLGLLPRFLVPWLVKPRVLKLCEKSMLLPNLMIAAKLHLLEARTLLGGAIKRVIRDPKIVYSPRAFVRDKFRQVFGTGSA